jgi:hypothetical protein
MSIVLSVLAVASVAFAAFCIWLGVRIVNRKERWAKWTLAGALIVGCPLGVAIQYDIQTRKNVARRHNVTKKRKVVVPPMKDQATPDTPAPNSLR